MFPKLSSAAKESPFAEPPNPKQIVSNKELAAGVTRGSQESRCPVPAEDGKISTLYWAEIDRTIAAAGASLPVCLCLMVGGALPKRGQQLVASMVQERHQESRLNSMPNARPRHAPATVAERSWPDSHAGPAGPSIARRVQVSRLTTYPQPGMLNRYIAFLLG